MANPSTIWGQLAIPNPAAGSIPFVYTDNFTIITDVSNFSYDPVGTQLFVAGGFNCGYLQNGVASNSPTVNTASGRVTVPAGNASFTLNNALILAASIVVVNMETNDATATTIKTIVPSLGKIVVTLNAASTSSITFSFIVFN
jgi:hypothetical protein